MPLGPLLCFKSGITGEKTRERAAEGRAGNFSRVRSIHDMAFHSATRVFREIPKSRNRDLARIGRPTGHRFAIAIVVDKKRIFRALGRAANFLSSTGRLHVAVAVRVHSGSSSPLAGASRDRGWLCRPSPQRAGRSRKRTTFVYAHAAGA